MFESGVTLIRHILTLAAVSLLVSGCGVYFHDAGLSEVAGAAEEKAGALDLPSVIATARANRSKLADQQVALLQRNAALQADILLAQAVTSNEPLGLSVWASDSFDDSLDHLGVTGALVGKTQNEILEELARVYRRLPEWEYRLRSRARRVEVYLEIMPTPCLPDLKIPAASNYLEAIPEDERGIFNKIYSDYKETCIKIQKGIEAALAPLLTANNDGAIAEAWTSWKKAEDDLEAKRAAARQKLVTLKAAKLQLAKANQPAPDLAAKLRMAAGELANAVKGFNVVCGIGAEPQGAASGTSAPNGGAFSDSIICGEKRDALGQLIEAVASGQDPTSEDAPPSLKQAAIIAAALPGLIGDVGAALEAGRKVPVAQLRLLQAQAEIDKTYAERAVERQEARVQQAMLTWRATLEEAHHLWQARKALCKATNTLASGIDTETEGIQCASMTIDVEVDPNDVLQRRQFVSCKYRIGQWQLKDLPGTSEQIPAFVPTEPLLDRPQCLLGKSITEAMTNKAVADDVKDALSHYYLATQTARAAQSIEKYRMTLIDGDEALDQDERALRLWAELIVVPVNSLASHYKGGLKAEDIANAIITGAGLGAIAGRVN